MADKTQQSLLMQMLAKNTVKTSTPPIQPTPSTPVIEPTPEEMQAAVRPEDVIATQLQPEMMPVPESNPFLIPASQTLTLPDPNGIVEQVTTVGAAKIEPDQMPSVYELAATDTTEFEPKDPNARREPQELIEAKKIDSKLAIDNETSVRALCDHIDTLIESNPKLIGPPLVDLRNYVQRLMITLKQRPEFDSVIIAKDVRNVMTFIRAARGEALELREVKTTKKAVRGLKKEGKELAMGTQDMMAKALNNVLLGGFKF